jgi:hypothetical protein
MMIEAKSQNQKHIFLVPLCLIRKKAEISLRKHPLGRRRAETAQLCAFSPERLGAVAIQPIFKLGIITCGYFCATYHKIVIIMEFHIIVSRVTLIL